MLQMEAKTYSAVNAKQSFGRMIDEAQHNPVKITKHNRDFAVILSNQKLNEIAEFFLGDYFLEQIKDGNMDVFEAIEEQIRILKNSEIARLEFESGECREATDEFYENIQNIALNLNK